MSGHLVTVAEAVKDQLNAASLAGDFAPLTFTSVRSWMPIEALEAQDELSVNIVPRGEKRRIVSRNRLDVDYMIDIGVQIKPADIENTDLDPYQALGEQIADFFCFDKLAASCSLTEGEILVTILPRHLEELRQFTAVMTLSFRGQRDPTPA